MRNVWPKAPRAYVLMSASVVFATSVFAQQTAEEAFNDANEILAVQRMYDDQKIQAQRALDAAKIQLAECANEESRAKIDAAAQKAAGKSQAAAGIFNSIGNSADDWGNAVNNLASGSKAEAEAEITEVRNLARASKGVISVSNGTPAKVSFNPTKAEEVCRDNIASTTQNFAYEIEKCIDRKKAEYVGYRERVSEANKTMNGAKDLLAPVMTTAIGAGVSAMGAHFQMSGVAAGTKAQLKNAKLVREQCELNAKNLIEDANRQLARFEKLKNQDLLNLALKRKTRDDGKVPPIITPNPGSGFAGPPDSGMGGGDSGGSGSGAAAPALASGGGAAGGGGGGAGGGGGGEASWGFGNGKGDTTGGGGLPPQPEAASYNSDGGGGGFGGFGGNSEMAAASSNEPGMMDDSYYSEDEMAFGDGGLEVLLARVTRRLTAHAGDLVKLPQQDMGVAKNPNEVPVERQPSSAKPVNVDRF